MAIELIKRIFKYNSVMLDDPDPSMTPDEVREFYGSIYPELSQSITEGPETNEKSVTYTFRRSIGTKG